MRIHEVRVQHWRNLRNVTLSVAPDTALVCLVGENGTGKSTVLELLSAAAHQLGISQGVELSRGNPLDEPHSFSVTATVPTDELDMDPIRAILSQQAGDWDGQLCFQSERTADGPTTSLTAPSVSAGAGISQSVAQQVVGQLRRRHEVQHLYLDADRSYPPMQVPAHQFAEMWSQDWQSADWNKQWAYRPTRTLYEEWIKYFIATEERFSTQLVADMRRAQRDSTASPAFVDPFVGFRQSVLAVLPHLHFTGVQLHGTSRTILFDTAGLELTFSQLSGGEREIAFLIGQMERFRLRRGLLMIDEPELHLNPDLLRAWLSYLRDTVENGQVWVATHSLEAVEVAGPQSTFVFERDPDTRLVQRVSLLEGRPVISALSAAIGAPAFSLNRLCFVYVEGDRQTRERERFFGVVGGPDVNRFLEGGSCDEVMRRLADVKELAMETGEQLHVGAVIDRDFRSDPDVTALESQSGIHVLRCHEVENLFLSLEALGVLLGRAGRSETPEDVVRAASDQSAGTWVAHHAAAVFSRDGLDVPRSVLAPFGSVGVSQLEAAWSDLAKQSASGLEDPTLRRRWRAAINSAVIEYRELRSSSELWSRCLGKETLPRVATAVGLSGATSLEHHVVQIWAEGAAPVPAELDALRAYVASLRP